MGGAANGAVNWTGSVIADVAQEFREKDKKTTRIAVSDPEKKKRRVRARRFLVIQGKSEGAPQMTRPDVTRK